MGQFHAVLGIFLVSWQKTHQFLCFVRQTDVHVGLMLGFAKALVEVIAEPKISVVTALLPPKGPGQI